MSSLAEAVDMHIERSHLVHLKRSSQHCWQRQYIDRALSSEHALAGLRSTVCHASNIHGNNFDSITAIDCQATNNAESMPYEWFSPNPSSAEPRMSSWSPFSDVDTISRPCSGAEKEIIHTIRTVDHDTTEMMVMAPRTN